MSFQPEQLINILLFVALAVLFWKVVVKWVRVAVVCIALIVVFANPFRFEQEGVSSIERFSSQDTQIPDRVVVDERSFEDKQKDQFNQLKTESKGIEDEI